MMSHSEDFQQQIASKLPIHPILKHVTIIPVLAHIQQKIIKEIKLRSTCTDMYNICNGHKLFKSPLKVPQQNQPLLLPYQM